MYPSKFSKSPAVAILLNNLLNSTFSVKKKQKTKMKWKPYLTLQKNHKNLIKCDFKRFFLKIYG